MKNTTFKKLSAAALAAVMAVSFAPAASLNVFAATKSITRTNPSTYTLASDEDEVNINTNDSGIITVDLNGQQNVKVTVVATNANIVLTDTKGAAVSGVVGGRRYETISQLTNTASKSLSITGNMTVKRSEVAKADIAKIFKDNNTAVPVAVTSDTSEDYLVGNTLISAAASEGNSIIAENGAVEVSGLKNASATIGADANADTTIKATAAANTALTTIVTTYTYFSNNKTGSGTYTDTAYYAGSTKGQQAVAALAAPTTSSPKTPAGVNVYSIPSYSRVITINTNGETWSGTPAKTGVYDAQDTDASTASGKVFGLTYFTSDPSAYFSGTVAVIDGNKYVLGADELKAVSRNTAKTSVKVIRGKNYSSASGNRTSKDTFPVAAGVTVSGPADESVVIETVTTVQGNTTTVSNSAIVFGTSESISGTYAKPTGIESKRNVNVAQVAQGATVDLTAADEVTVSRGSGVGYYSYPSSTTETKYSFGPTTVITNAFKNFVAPHTANGLTIPAVNDTVKATSVFASKEIKTTVSGVAKTVTIKGETSAKVTATSGDTQTWEVNADAKSTAAPVVTYRLYDRNRGEHLYTYSSLERDMLVKAGWKEEPSNIKVLPVSASEGIAIYRVYNPNFGGTHMYTQNPAEVQFLLQNGWKEGKVVFRTAESTTAGAVPVYRLKNPNSKNGEHQFTTSAAERTMLLNATWGDEGIAFYSFK